MERNCKEENLMFGIKKVKINNRRIRSSMEMRIKILDSMRVRYFRKKRTIRNHLISIIKSLVNKIVQILSNLRIKKNGKKIKENRKILNNWQIINKCKILSIHKIMNRSRMNKYIIMIRNKI